MRHIFGNMKKYWLQVLLILGLLVIQAYCDLSLPDYTSVIIDTGIANYGIEHCVPEYFSKDGHDLVSIFMTEEENEEFDSLFLYNEDKDYYVLKDTSDSAWEETDARFGKVISVCYMLNSQASGAMDISKLANIDLSNFDEDSLGTMEKIVFNKITDSLSEMGVDIYSPTLVLDIRYAMEDKIALLGDSIVASMGKQFARSEYEKCNIDIVDLQSKYMWRIGAKMLLMALSICIINILVGLIASRVGAGIGRDLRGKVFKKVMSFSNAGIDRFSTASLITRSTNDVQQIQLVSVIILRIVLYAPILAIGGIINIRHYKSGMAWVIVLAIALVLCVIGTLVVVAMPKFQIMQDLIDKVNLVAREILTGIPVVRAFCREKREEERFDEANSELTNVMLFTNRSMAFMLPSLTLIMNGISVLIIWVAAHRIDEGALEVGAMTAFITYSMLIIMGFLMITMVAILLPRAAVAADRIHELISADNIIKEKEDGVDTVPEDVSVCFDNVAFMYPYGEENAIEGINFTAKAGETTAIIGSTGCGKSTLIKLIPRFYDCSEGAITIGGTNIKDYKIDTLRKMIGYVPQKGILFSGDIEENIAYGQSEFDAEAVKEAAKIAQAYDFIMQKPNEFKEAVAQGGNNVSGGQKQRLAIARAIARNPKIYIFDDSFSALDFKTDTALRKALAEKTKDATVIIVAQRVSTILNANQIICLEDGKMIGKGTHKELVNSCDTYRQIAESQLSESEFLRSIGAESGKEEC